MNGRCHKQGHGLKAFGGSPTPKLPSSETSLPPPTPGPTPDSSMSLISIRQLSLFIKWTFLIQ